MCEYIILEDYIMEKYYYLYLTTEERRYIFNALLAYRNKLISQSRYTDAVDEVMIKFSK